MATKTERQKLVAKLDKAVTEYMKLKYGKCVLCGSTDRLGNGHVFSRVAYSTRWDIEEGGNCYLQCWADNYRHEYDPYPYFNWYKNKFGEDKFDELHRRFVTPVKYSTPQLEELLAHIKEETKHLTDML